MSIKIHHGPPGSYKTSGAVWEDFVKAALDGRTIVTNVRGLDSSYNVQKVLKRRARAQSKKSLLLNKKRLIILVRHYQKGNIKKYLRRAKSYRAYRAELISHVNVINVDTSVSEGKDRMRRWFQWVPLGSFLIIDEINTIYPKSWTSKRLEQYDYEGGEDLATQAGRPYNATQALEMHRHYNFDIVVTTPNIKKVHDIFRQSAEVAYRHKNTATIGLPGSYWEYMHEADNDGRAHSDILLKRRRKVPKWVFRLYSSTATGKTSDTKAGQSVFLQPVPVAISIFLVFGVWFAVGRVSHLFNKGTETFKSAKINTKTEIQSTQNIGSTHQKTISKDNSLQTQSLNVVSSYSVNTLAEQLMREKIEYVGNIWGVDMFTIKTGYFKKSELLKVGIKVTRHAACVYELSANERSQLVYCPVHIEQEIKANILGNDLGAIEVPPV